MKTLKNYWVCLVSRGIVDYTSISYTKKGSIKRFMTDDPVNSWDWWKSKGWRCVRVNITFEEVKKETP